MTLTGTEVCVYCGYPIVSKTQDCVSVNGALYHVPCFDELLGISLPASVAGPNVEIPEGLCGFEETADILNGMNEVIETHTITGQCVFLAGHKGEHSWQK